MSSLKLLHIADVHLDAPFKWLGSKGKEQRAQLKATFRAVMDLAVAERVDALLIAGDLFDSNTPAQDTIQLVQAELGRLKVPVCILPGTHDCYDDNSIYRKVDFTATAGPHVHVFRDPNASALALPELGLTMHARANTTKTSRVSPLNGLQPNPNTRNVALAHGSMVIGHEQEDFPLERQEIAACGMDYVALGHWHSFQEFSAGRTRAWYSGPPELIANGECGQVVLVELGDGRARVDGRSVARRRAEAVDLDVSGMRSPEEIRQRIAELADANLFLTVNMRGMRPLGLMIDIAELAQEVENLFFALKVADQSHPTLTSDELEALPENTVIGQFARRMEALIAAATTNEERGVRENALQLGVALLQGKKVLP